MRRLILWLTLCVPLTLLAAPLELQVLGSGGPGAYGRASSSYLVLVQGVPRVLIDAGPGAFTRIGENHISLEKVDTVLLTHLHIDHSGDLPAFFLARSLANRRSLRFHIFGPEGGGLFPSTSRFVDLLLAKGGAWEYQKTFGADEDIQVTNLAATLESKRKTILDENGLQIEAIATHHGDAPSVAYRITSGGRSIVFSGDMDVSALDNLELLAKDATLLVFNCVVLDRPNSPAILYQLHTPPRQIGEAAKAAAVKRLLLTHLAPAIEEQQIVVLHSIRRSYSGPVQFAKDSLRLTVE